MSEQELMRAQWERTGTSTRIYVQDSHFWIADGRTREVSTSIINDHNACTGMGKMQQGIAKKAKDALHEALPLIEGPAVLRHGAAKDWETKEWQSFMNDDEKRASAKIRAALAGLGEGLG